MKALKIINHFGWKSQLKKLNEEIYEFYEAIMDFENGIGTLDHVEEELADVFVILNGFKALFKLRISVKLQCNNLINEFYEFVKSVNDYEYYYGEIESVEDSISKLIATLYGYLNFYHLSKENIKKIINYKLDRTLKRISIGYYEK